MPKRSYFRSLLDKVHEIEIRFRKGLVIAETADDQYLRDLLEDVMLSLEGLTDDASEYSHLT